MYCYNLSIKHKEIHYKPLSEKAGNTYPAFYSKKHLKHKEAAI